MTRKELDLFFALIERIQNGAIQRVKTYAEIGRDMGGVTKQAIEKRVRKLGKQHQGIAEFVVAVRRPAKPQNFSEMSPTDRQERGIDRGYNYDAG